MAKKPTKAEMERQEQEFLRSLPPDRFGVNPRDHEPIQPKGARKGSKRKIDVRKP